jgi:hypothetical protein
MILTYIQNTRDRRSLPSLKARISVEGTKRMILCLSLLCFTGVYAHNANEQLIEYPSKDEYMVELYQRIVEACKIQENPKSILVVIPLELIIVSGQLPDELNAKIMEITQCIEKNEDPNIDANATIKLVSQMIPYTKLIDSRIAKSIKELQKMGVKIVAISSFIPELSNAALKHMKTLGLDFSSTALYKNEMPIEDEDGNRVALSKNGVVFMNDYFQAMNVLETMIANYPSEIEQLYVASPMQDQDIEIS